jgi:hypothetical protein
VKPSASLPRELQAAPLVREPSDFGLLGMPPLKRQKIAQGSPFASRFKKDLDKAAAKTKPAPFMAHQLCDGLPDVKDLFGAEFLNLLSGGGQPCIQYFIFGNCPRGDECRLCHTLSSSPSPNILNGIAKRVKTRVDKFLPKV